MHAYGQIFGFYRAHSHRMALHFYHRDDGGGFATRITTSSTILVPFTLLGSPHPIMLSCDQESKGGFSSSVECLHVALSSLGFFFQFLSAVFRRRHCCSSWRWREEEVPGVRCCCPGLFEYGALGRGRWPAAAHPHGPPCDKPGNVE